MRVVREAEFGRDDVVTMAGALEYRESLGPHGIPMQRATAKGARFRAAPIPVEDKAQKALIAAQKKYYDQYPDRDPKGDLWSVVEVTD